MKYKLSEIFKDYKWDSVFLNKMSLAGVVAVSNILEIQCNTIAMTSSKGTFEHPYFPQRSQLILWRTLWSDFVYSIHAVWSSELEVGTISHRPTFLCLNLWPRCVINLSKNKGRFCNWQHRPRKQLSEILYLRVQIQGGDLRTNKFWIQRAVWWNMAH